MSVTDLVTFRNFNSHAAAVFVHGFTGGAKDTWSAFASCLSAEPSLSGWDLFSAGYSTNLRIDFAGLWSADPELKLITTLLHTTLTVPPLSRYKALAIIAHSMGGLPVQRALLDYVDVRARITHVFLFGTPSGGLTKARLLWRFKRQLRDMDSRGAFITSLRNDWNTKLTGRLPFSLTVVAGENDEFVPFASSLAPFDPSMQESIAGNHLDIIRASDGNHPGVRLVVGRLNNKPAIGPWDSGRLAAEAGDFQRTIDLLEPNQDKIDDAAAVQLAIALEKCGRETEAINLLIRRKSSYTDAMGALAGRLKRRWLRERVEADADRALKLYCDAYELSKDSDPHQAYYHAINVAFIQLVYKKNFGAVEEWARRTLEHCSSAAGKLGDAPAWRFATEGEAKLLLRHSEAGFAHYRQAIAVQPDPWQLESMFMQALEVARQLEDKQLAVHLAAIFNKPSI